MNLYDGIPRFVLSVMLFILAILRTWRQTLQMYKATKQWQLNRLMQQLMEDSVLYFLVYVHSFVAIIIMFSYSSYSRARIQKLTTGTWMFSLDF